MTLKLNPTRETYKEFYGRNTEQMPKIIADDRVPMNFAQLMQIKLDVRNSDDELKSSYMDNYFDTADAVAYHPQGNLKVILDSQHLRQINPQSKLRNGALVVEEGIYEKYDGQEFTREELEKYVGKFLTKKQVLENPILRTLARHPNEVPSEFAEDKNLLKEYADFIFTEAGERFGYDALMGIFPDLADRNTPEMRAWCVSWLGDRSNLFGKIDLNFDCSRLIGVAQEVLIDKAMKRLEGILHPDALKSFVDLRKKL